MNRGDVRAEISKKDGREVTTVPRVRLVPTLMSLGPQRTATRWRLISRQATQVSVQVQRPNIGTIIKRVRLWK
jgi:hypothetical protein